MNNKDKDIQNPEKQFDRPKDIVVDKELSLGQKKKALNTWEQDEHQLLTASNEGMPGAKEGLDPNDQPRLDEVVKAKAKIGELPKQKPSH